MSEQFVCLCCGLPLTLDSDELCDGCSDELYGDWNEDDDFDDDWLFEDDEQTEAFWGDPDLVYKYLTERPPPLTYKIKQFYLRCTYCFTPIVNHIRFTIRKLLKNRDVCPF